MFIHRDSLQTCLYFMCEVTGVNQNVYIKLAVVLSRGRYQNWHTSRICNRAAISTTAHADTDDSIVDGIWYTEMRC